MFWCACVVRAELAEQQQQQSQQYAEFLQFGSLSGASASHRRNSRASSSSSSLLLSTFDHQRTRLLLLTEQDGVTPAPFSQHKQLPLLLNSSQCVKPIRRKLYHPTRSLVPGTEQILCGKYVFKNGKVHVPDL